MVDCGILPLIARGVAKTEISMAGNATRPTFELACFPCEEHTEATISSIEKNRGEKNNMTYG